MPYPDCITPKMQSKIKYNYAMAQFAAAISCISEQPQLSWATLLAIQGAPLLMTLVRKGKISSLTYHRVYMVLLTSPMYWFLLGNMIHWKYADINQHTSKLIFVTALLHLIATAVRIRFRKTKLVTWTIMVVLFNGLTKIPQIWGFFHWLYTHPIGLAILTFRYIMVSQRVLRHYVPVFTGATQAPQQWDYLWINALIGFGRSATNSLLEVIITTVPDQQVSDATMVSTNVQGILRKSPAKLVVATSPRFSRNGRLCESPFEGPGRELRRRFA